MIREILPVGALQCNCTVFGDETTREAIVVDPGDGSDLARLEAVLAKHQLRVKAIVITHAHIDHLGGANKLRASTGAPVWMNASDHELSLRLDMQAAWLGMPEPESPVIDEDARDGATLHLSGTEFHVLHTPGHTPGSMCLYAPALQVLAAGDTLFLDSVGRTDLPGGDGHALFRSIKTKLLKLPDETEVICGHGPRTTIGRERNRNPFLRGL
jgi:glyoxylase-like metal-dependent hydrolase (beta-lactamase superfamily II)